MTTPPKSPLDARRDLIFEVIMQWKHFWMNQKQNDEADYQNYLHRAMGVNANMKHDLANRINKALTELAKAPKDEALTQAHAEIERLVSNINNKQEMYEDAIANIEKLEAENSRLREALEEITKGSIGTRAHSIASKALEGK